MPAGARNRHVQRRRQTKAADGADRLAARVGQRRVRFGLKQKQLAGWDVRIASYRLGDRFVCEVDNVDPAARLARADGATRIEAEVRALEKAAELLRRTRVHAPA